MRVDNVNSPISSSIQPLRNHKSYGWTSTVDTNHLTLNALRHLLLVTLLDALSPHHLAVFFFTFVPFSAHFSSISWWYTFFALPNLRSHFLFLSADDNERNENFPWNNFSYLAKEIMSRRRRQIPRRPETMSGREERQPVFSFGRFSSHFPPSRPFVVVCDKI